MTTSERPTSDAWKLVPVEPTEKMIEAHFLAHARAKTVFADVRDIWSAMLASAPAGPAIGLQAVKDATAQLALIHSLANDITENNFADKRLYILQTCVRLSDILSALHPAPEAASAGAEELRGEIAYALTKRLVIDMPTARAAVDEALKHIVFDDDEPLTADDQAMIDAAWDTHKAALPAARVIDDNQPGNTAIVEVLVSPPTLEVGTELFAAPQSAFRKNDDDKPLPNAVMERLYQAARAVADNIAEFGTVTDGERIDALDAALNALSDTAPSPKGVSDGVRAARAFLDSEASFYGSAAGRLDGIPFEHVAHICRIMAHRLEAALSQEHAPGRKESQ